MLIRGIPPTTPSCFRAISRSLRRSGLWSRWTVRCMTAIYEVRNEQSVADVVRPAGGPATRGRHSAKWRSPASMPLFACVVPQVDLSEAGRAEEVATATSSMLRARSHSRCRSCTAILFARGFAYRGGMRLTDVLRSWTICNRNADLHYVPIRRELPRITASRCCPADPWRR